MSAINSPIIEGLDKAGLESYLNKRQYNALYFPVFFPIKNVNQLDSKTLIGEEGSRVAAEIISYNSKAPLYSRKSMTTKFFDIPKIAISRPKDEKQILEHEITKRMYGINAVIEDYYNDVDFCVDGCLARQEWLALTAMSTGKIQLTASNNPKGIVNETVIDFGIPTANKKVVSVVHSTGNAATMKFIEDAKAVVKAGRDKGITFEKMLMHPDEFDLITGSTEFQTACKSLIVGESQLLGMLGLELVNKVLRSLRLPEIALIETSLEIEDKAGARTAVNPWSSTHILFVPQLQLGNMHNAPIAEEIEKPVDVVQAKKGNVLISVKKDFNPISIITKGECNAFPSWPSVDKCFSLYTNSASTWA